MDYAGLQGAHDKTQPHVGGNIKVGDPFTFCPSVWGYVIDRFGITSVLDLGSGAGNSAEYFFRRGLRTVAIEGFEPSVRTSIYPAVLHDLTKSAVITRVDLVHCHEVVEHIEEAFLDNLLLSLLCGKYVLLTHALPGQHGYHHVNLKPSEYWIKHLEERGCTLLSEDTNRVRRFAEVDGAQFMAKSGLLLVNRARL